MRNKMTLIDVLIELKKNNFTVKEVATMLNIPVHKALALWSEVTGVFPQRKFRTAFIVKKETFFSWARKNEKRIDLEALAKLHEKDIENITKKS